MNQATLAAPCEVEGKGLHLGLPARMRLLPAPPRTGFVFVVNKGGRSAEVSACPDHLQPKVLRTALSAHGVVVETVEHVLAAAYGLGLSNLYIELSEVEPPACDGSAFEISQRMLEAGIVEQKEARDVLAVAEPVSVLGDEGASITIFPADKLCISYTLAGDGLPAQNVTYEHSRSSFLKLVAPARTFCREFEVERLRHIPEVGEGADETNTLVVSLDNYERRQKFANELAYHKVLDLLGDLSLLGKDVRGHLVCHRSGHSCNHLLLRKLEDLDGRHTMSIHEIRKILPHSYPFLLVDRVLDYEENVRVVGLKNVTINEPFFQGHYPHEPIMPGVLLVEALAQTGAIMLYRNQPKGKLILFVGVDKVRFRNRVVPGDQLILEVTAKNMKSNIGLVKGIASVKGSVACEAEIRFMIVDG